MAFAPGDVSFKSAQSFHRRLHGRLVAKRVSKYDQPQTFRQFAPGAISVFLQGPSQIVERAQYMSEVQMVKAILDGSQERQVLVKPHPNAPDPDTVGQIRQLLAQAPNLEIVDANVHDMLGGAAICASICSSVAIEAMIHKVPVLSFGQSDFHHCAQTVKDPNDTANAIKSAIVRDWPYETFLHWFLNRMMINTNFKDWPDKVIARMGVFSPSNGGA